MTKLENISLIWLWQNLRLKKCPCHGRNNKVEFGTRTTKLESGRNKAREQLTCFTWSVKVQCAYPKWLLTGPVAAAHWCVRRWTKSLWKMLTGVTLKCRKLLPMCSPFTVYNLSVEIWMAGSITVHELAMTQHSVLLPWTRSDLKSLYILKICCHVCVWPQPLRSCCKTSTKMENNNIIRKWFFCQ